MSLQTFLDNLKSSIPLLIRVLLMAVRIGPITNKKNGAGKTLATPLRTKGHWSNHRLHILLSIELHDLSITRKLFAFRNREEKTQRILMDRRIT